MNLNKKENNELSDDKLVELIQQGNKVAFTHVYHKYSKMVYALGLRYLKDKELAQETVQYTFVKLWEIHKKIAITTSIKNYLYTIAKNYIINEIRNNKSVIYNYKEKQQFVEDTSITVEKEETLHEFYKAIERLPVRKKQVCLLKMEGQLSNEEIAETLNISVSTVKTHYAQSKALLKQQLEKVLIFITLALLF